MSRLMCHVPDVAYVVNPDTSGRANPNRSQHLRSRHLCLLDPLRLITIQEPPDQRRLRPG
jgi:hypothetical protein